MKRVAVRTLGIVGSLMMLSSVLTPLAAAQQQPGREVYRCPGNPVLYTDTLSAKEARDKGCRTLEGTPITVVQAAKPRSGGGTSASSPSTARPADQRVDPSDQRARDSDARRILESELKREEERLGQMQKDYNKGEPERLGDERNYQKYLDRVADMKASITRKENDIAAIKRELSKLPQ